MRQNNAWNRLTSDITAGLTQPLIEISGNHRVLIELHRGIKKYERDLIEIEMGYGSARILGSNLEIAQINRQQLVITGEITAVSLLGGGTD